MLMFSFQETPDSYFQYGLSGTRDYMFDYYFIGRSDQSGIWSPDLVDAHTAVYHGVWLFEQ